MDEELEEFEIQQFLLVYDRAADLLVEERHLGTDGEAATEIYTQAERRYADQPNMTVVLIGSDSIETVKRTHSTFFGGRSPKDLVLDALRDAEAQIASCA